MVLALRGRKLQYSYGPSMEDVDAALDEIFYDSEPLSCFTFGYSCQSGDGKTSSISVLTAATSQGSKNTSGRSVVLACLKYFANIRSMVDNVTL